MTEKIETDSEGRKFKVKIQLELKIETGHKAPKFKVNNTVTINKYKNILVKNTLEIGQEKYLLSILF